jgi:hypothetical protein
MRDRAEIEADCREPSVICCATHARLLGDVPALLAALDEANTALVRETARADQNTKAALDYAAQMERLQALPARVVAAERELAEVNAEIEQLQARIDGCTHRQTHSCGKEGR